MKTAVVGLGYVGLANAAMLAEHCKVVALDVSFARVNAINARISPIEDSTLQEWLQLEHLNLVATLDSREAYLGADYVIVAVPTSYDPVTNAFDTSIVETVIDDAVTRLGPEREDGSSPAIVIRSTVPVGFTARMAERHPHTRFLFMPEFLREGSALADTLHPSRVVVGGGEVQDLPFVQLYSKGSVGDEHWCTTDEAEAVKLFANSYLAMRVAFFNELDTYAMHKDLDTRRVLEAVCADPRVGTGYNNPSFGYGGYCLPKDTKQLRANYSDVPETLISAIVSSNTTRKDAVAESILASLPILACREPVVGIYRLTMKAGSDNFRDSAVQGIMKRLNAKGVKLVVFEPSLEADIFYGARVIGDLEEFLKAADLVVTNRLEPELDRDDVRVYTRDVYGRD